MKIFYGWRMVAAGSGIQFLQAGLLHQAFGAYFAVLADERGWSKTALSGAAALQPMEAAVLGPVLGWIIDRFGPQGMIRIGIIVFGAGFILLSRIETLAGFYAAFIVIALGASLCGFFPINVAIIHWFEKRRARALSVLALGLALGGAFVPVVAWSMQGFGWRATAFASGVLAILVGWPLARTCSAAAPRTMARRSTACRRRRRSPPARANPAQARSASTARARRCAPAPSGCSRSATAPRCSSSTR